MDFLFPGYPILIMGAFYTNARTTPPDLFSPVNFGPPFCPPLLVIFLIGVLSVIDIYFRLFPPLYYNQVNQVQNGLKVESYGISLPSPRSLFCRIIFCWKPSFRRFEPMYTIITSFIISQLSFDKCVAWVLITKHRMKEQKIKTTEKPEASVSNTIVTTRTSLILDNVHISCASEVETN